MSRITSPTGAEFLSGLEDDTPYKATIHEIDWETSEYKGKTETQMVLWWQLEGASDVRIREYVGMRLGTQQNGQVSKLRQILNAVGNQPKTAEIAWFDDETLEWSYDGNKPYAKLDVGLPVIIRGETIEKTTENGKKRRFVITGYRPAGIAEKPPAPQPAGRPRMVGRSEPDDRNIHQDDDDKVPF